MVGHRSTVLPECGPTESSAPETCLDYNVSKKGKVSAFFGELSYFLDFDFLCKTFPMNYSPSQFEVLKIIFYTVC